MKRYLWIILVASPTGCAPAGDDGLAAPRQVDADKLTFIGTVTSVDIRDLHHPLLKFVVNLKIDEVLSGTSPGESFWFAIHSPSQEGVDVGQRYRIAAKKIADGYEVISRDRLKGASVDDRSRALGGGDNPRAMADPGRPRTR